MPKRESVPTRNVLPEIKNLIAASRPAAPQARQLAASDVDNGTPPLKDVRSRFWSFCRLPEVMALTGLSRATIYAMMARGEFPASVDLGARSVAWIRSEIEGWIEQQICKSRASAALPSRKLPKALRVRQSHDAVPPRIASREADTVADSA